MKKKNTLIFGSLLFLSLSVIAQDKKAPANPHVTKSAPVEKDAKPAEAQPGQPSEAEQKMWMDYMTPGEMHKMLSASSGDWHEDLTFWMAPGAPASKAESECNNKMILDGRYQESIHKGMMMGMPFEGRSTVAFDNAKKVFQSTWIDNMGSGIMCLEGKYDEKTNSVNFKGKMVDPSIGKEVNVREVMKFVDEKTQIMEMYQTGKDGKEWKSMEIKFTRR